MKPPSPTADRIFGAILALCLFGIVISGIAWAMGWEYGPLGMITAGACANVPMFHFAMHWPFRRERKASKGGHTAPDHSDSE